ARRPSVGLVQRGPQKVAELGQHAVGQLDVLVDELGDGVEGVEQEVRVQLHLEDLQLGLGQLRLQLRGEQLALAPAAVVVEDVPHRHDGPVKDDVVVELGDEIVDQHVGRDGRPDEFVPQDLGGQHRQDGGDEAASQTGGDVDGE